MKRSRYFKTVPGGILFEDAAEVLRVEKEEGALLKKQMGCEHIQFVYDVEVSVQYRDNGGLPSMITTGQACEAIVYQISTWRHVPLSRYTVDGPGRFLVHFERLSKAVRFAGLLSQSNHPRYVLYTQIGLLVKENKGKAKAAVKKFLKTAGAP